MLSSKQRDSGRISGAVCGKVVVGSFVIVTTVTMRNALAEKHVTIGEGHRSMRLDLKTQALLEKYQLD